MGGAPSVPRFKFGLSSWRAIRVQPYTCACRQTDVRDAVEASRPIIPHTQRRERANGHASATTGRSPIGRCGLQALASSRGLVRRGTNNLNNGLQADTSSSKYLKRKRTRRGINHNRSRLSDAIMPNAQVCMYLSALLPPHEYLRPRLAPTQFTLASNLSRIKTP